MSENDKGNKNIMANEAKNSLKSAYDLACARFAGQGDSRPLTQEQKEAIADVERQGKAKIAEREIMLKSRLAQAGADEEKIGKLKGEHQAEIAKIKEKAEAEKEKIRNG